METFGASVEEARERLSLDLTTYRVAKKSILITNLAEIITIRDRRRWE